MTYHTLKCPHCKKIVNQATGSPSYIGNPFRECPWCGGIYTDSFTQEWITKSPFQRFKYLIDKPLAGGFLSFVATAGFLSMAEVDIIGAAFVGVAVAIIVFVSWFFVRKSNIEAEIKESLLRTKSAKYVAALKKAGYKIHPIDGVEIGTINDITLSPDEGKNIKNETRNSFTLH